MTEIQNDKISILDSKFITTCKCGKVSKFSTKNSAIKMLNRGTCRYCRKYVKVESNSAIYLNNSGKWCSTCSGCGKEQAYTRKDHAKQSEVADWQCKSCVAKAKTFEANRPVGDKQRVYNKFNKSAADRGIKWELTLESMYKFFTGKCALTGWDISIAYQEQTASLDRIDSSKGYIENNIQWVHSMVNMCKNKYKQEVFIDMCKAIAKVTERKTL